MTSHSFRSPTQVCDICARNDRVVIVPAPMTGIGTHTPAALPSGMRVYAITVAFPHNASGVAVPVGVAEVVAVGVCVGVWVGIAVGVAVGVSVAVGVGVGVAVGSLRIKGRKAYCAAGVGVTEGVLPGAAVSVGVAVSSAPSWRVIATDCSGSGACDTARPGAIRMRADTARKTILNGNGRRIDIWTTYSDPPEPAPIVVHSLGRRTFLYV